MVQLTARGRTVPVPGVVVVRRAVQRIVHVVVEVRLRISIYKHT